jgi:aryl-alcohol dehydrogenase-like predicted oxidoreductase
MASLMATNRSKVFLATKTGERSGTAARIELEESLTRLGVDQVDLIQLHNLVEPDEGDVAFALGGAVEALVRARDEGLTRFVGVTGHGVRIPEMHSRSLERCDFDSVLLPYNHAMLANETYRADVERLLETCADRNVAVGHREALERGRWSAVARQVQLV